MPQDWFSQNAPQQAGGDWFSQNAPTQADGKSVGGFIDNIGASGARLVTDAVKSVPATARLALQSLMAAPFTPQSRELGEVVPAVAEHYKERYGGVDKALNTLYSDPVGVAFEASALAPRAATSAAVAATTAKAGRKMVDLAPRAVQAAVKPTVAELRKQSGASMTGLQGQADKVSRTLLRNRWTKPGQADAAIVDTERKIQAALTPADDAAVQPLLDTAQRVPRYLKKIEQSASRQAIPGSDVGTIRNAMDGVLEGPLAQTVQKQKPIPGLARTVEGPTGLQTEQATRMVPERAMRANITPQEGLDIARSTGRWSNRKAWGELKGAETEASKAVERAIRDSVKEAVPEAKPLLQKQGDALMLRPILDRMALRTSNRDVVGLPAWVAAGPELAAGKVPYTAMVAQFLRNQQLPLGYALDDVGRSLMKNAGRTGAVAPDALRAAILSELLGATESPSR